MQQISNHLRQPHPITLHVHAAVRQQQLEPDLPFLEQVSHVVGNASQQLAEIQPG